MQIGIPQYEIEVGHMNKDRHETANENASRQTDYSFG